MLGEKVIASPLGGVAKQKSAYEWKHRLITDLAASRAKAGISMPEWQVLPRFKDHAADLAQASAMDAATVLLLCTRVNFQTWEARRPA